MDWRASWPLAGYTRSAKFRVPIFRKGPLGDNNNFIKDVSLAVNVVAAPDGIQVSLGRWGRTWGSAKVEASGEFSTDRTRTMKDGIAFSGRLLPDGKIELNSFQQGTVRYEGETIASGSRRGAFFRRATKPRSFENKPWPKAEFPPDSPGPRRNSAGGYVTGDF